MTNFLVTVYTGQFSEQIWIKAYNQDNLKQRVRGMGYDRVGHISRTERA